MNKQELVHLHGLFAQVENYYENATADTVEHNRYAELDLKPTSLHRSKADHKNAVFSLANDLATAIENNDTEESAEPWEWMLEAEKPGSSGEEYEVLERLAEEEGTRVEPTIYPGEYMAVDVGLVEEEFLEAPEVSYGSINDYSDSIEQKISIMDDGAAYLDEDRVIIQTADPENREEIVN